jgi:hypothetical protein
MSNFSEGTVVITLSTQAGTVIQNASGDIWVLLANGEIVVCPTREVRLPQSAEDLAACPYAVERVEAKRSIRRD